MTELFISVDIGTTNTKGALMDAGGRLLSSHSIGHLVQSPQPGWAEHDMEQNWWLDAVRIIRRLMEDSGVRPEGVRSIMVSGMCPSIGLTDEEGRPLRNGITQSDIREPEHTLFDFGVTPWDHCEKSTYIIPRLLWVRENEPEEYGKVRKLFYAHSYLYYRLTGCYAIDFNTACWVTPLFNPQKKEFDPQVLAEIGLGLCELPQVKSPIDANCFLSEEAAELTGLTTNTRVCVGTGDFYESLMAAGVRGRGDGMLYFGSVGMYFGMAEDLSVFLKKPTMMGLPKDPIEMGPAFPVSGILLEWFRAEFAKAESVQAKNDRKNFFAWMDEKAARLPIGADRLIFLPHLNGERNPAKDPHARGVLYGLRLDHSVTHVYRAIMESYCYSVRQAMEEMVKNGEVTPVHRISVSGGGAKSALWRQITSDVLGVETIYNPCGEETLAGCYLAAMGAGYFSDLDPFYQQWLQSGTIKTVPIPANEELYDKVYGMYQRIYGCLSGTYQGLEALPGK